MTAAWGCCHVHADRAAAERSGVLLGGASELVRLRRDPTPRSTAWRGRCRAQRAAAATSAGDVPCRAPGGPAQGGRAVRPRPGAQRRRRRCSRELPLRHWRPLGLDGHGPPRRGWRAGGEDGGQVRRLERLPPGLDRRQTGSQPGLGSVPFRRPGSRRRARVRKHAGRPPAARRSPGLSPGRRSASSTATFRLHVHRQRAAGQRLTERDSETVESRGPRVPEMPEQQVSLQELESELDRYIHDVENGATVVVSRDGRQVARIIPETDSAEQKRAALKASGTFDWSGRRPKSRRPSVRLRDGGSVSDIIINERR